LLVALAPWQANSVSAASNCDGGDLSIDAEEASFFDVLNRHRADHGLQSLTLSPALNRVAAWMARDMAQHSHVAHADSLGRDPFRRMAECGFPFTPAGEDLAAGTSRDSGRAAFDLLRSSPQHNEIMLDPEFSRVGVAREYLANSTHSWYWAVEFGPADAVPTPTALPVPQNVTPVVNPATAPLEAAPVPASPVPVFASSGSNSALEAPEAGEAATVPPARPLAGVARRLAAAGRQFARRLPHSCEAPCPSGQGETGWWRRVWPGP
jgi:hypothetical protein